MSVTLQRLGSCEARPVTPDDDMCRHLSLCNPQGRSQGDLPKLLRRVATLIAGLGPDTMVLDMTIDQEITAEGPWFSATVYYVPDGWKE